MHQRLFLLLAAGVVAISACSGDDAAMTEPRTSESATTTPATNATGTEGPVTIATVISFPFSDESWDRGKGTFTVIEGADVLGCAEGTFSETPVEPRYSVVKTMTCTSGPRVGDFAITMSVTPRFEPANKVGDLGRPDAWTITDASGDFEQLTGSGDVRFGWTGWIDGEEELTGTIQIDSST